MIFRRKKNEKKEKQYARVYELHEKSTFLCYIDDVYQEAYEGRSCVKLEGVVALGIGTVEDTYVLYSCTGKKKAEITVDEFYIKNDSVKQLEAGDKRVAIYPKDQDVAFCAGDMLCKLEDEML